MDNFKTKTVFTLPWKGVSCEQLSELVYQFGSDPGRLPAPVLRLRGDVVGVRVMIYARVFTDNKTSPDILAGWIKPRDKVIGAAVVDSPGLEWAEPLLVAIGEYARNNPIDTSQKVSSKTNIRLPKYKATFEKWKIIYKEFQGWEMINMTRDSVYIGPVGEEALREFCAYLDNHHKTIHCGPNTLRDIITAGRTKKLTGEFKY